MLIIAGLLVVIITVLEALVLPPLHLSASYAFMIVPLGNLTIAGLVGYFVFANIRVPRATPHSSSRAMRVVGDTLPLLRRGLSPASAAKAARVMATFDDVQAAVVADQTGLLALEGFAAEALNREILHEHMNAVMETRKDRLLRVNGRPVAISLLRSRGKILGTLGLVGGPALERQNQRELVRLAGVLAQLLAMQVELGQMDRQAQLVAEAELTALRAQINPHFLFNALNTIISYSREDPQTTRRLLLRLADLFRGSMRSSGQMLPFADEYEQITNYLYIEQARFRDKLTVDYDIDPQVLKVEIPALSVQPLVENAVRHGITPKSTPGTITLTARVDFLAMRVVIRVQDDGVGMDPDLIPDLLRPRPDRRKGDHGLGLANINERLRRLYGENCRLSIESSPGKGTTVTMRIPMR